MTTERTEVMLLQPRVPRGILEATGHRGETDTAMRPAAPGVATDVADSTPRTADAGTGVSISVVLSPQAEVPEELEVGGSSGSIEIGGTPFRWGGVAPGGMLHEVAEVGACYLVGGSAGEIIWNRGEVKCWAAGEAPPHAGPFVNWTGTGVHGNVAGEAKP